MAANTPYRGPERRAHESAQMMAMRQLATALHDLCQPLTTLQCRMEMAVLIDTPEGYQTATQAGMEECLRLGEVISEMREVVRQATEATIARDATEFHAPTLAGGAPGSVNK